MSGSGVECVCLNSDGSFKWNYPMGSTPYFNFSSPTVAKIDDSDTASVLVNNQDSVLYCLNANNGNLKWVFLSGYSNKQYRGSPTVANVDTLGHPEILFGSRGDHAATLFCLNSDGSIKWTYHTGYGVPTPAVQRIDTMVDPAVLITSGGRLICLNGTDGSLRWQSDSIPVGGIANIADLDRDCEPEILVTRGESLYCFLKDGSVKWSDVVVSPGNYLRTPIAIADLDFLPDSLPEMVIYCYETDSLYCLRENSTGTGVDLVLQQQAEDNIWGGSSPGPFIWEIGDTHRVVAWCANYLGCYNGPDGKHPDGGGNPFYKNTNFNSLTGCEHPTVADIDNDGHSDLLAVYDSPGGIGVLTSTAWKDLRNLVSGYLYHITNINDDLTVPRLEPRSWYCHNTWLAQVPWECGECEPQGIEESWGGQETIPVNAHPGPFTRVLTIEYTIPVSGAFPP